MHAWKAVNTAERSSCAPEGLSRRAPRQHPLAAGLLVTLLALLGACGGGGGGGGAASPPPSMPAANQPPVAAAGGTQTVDAAAAVTLDAGASSDSDGRISEWSWLQTDGPTVDLQGSDEALASFTAPSPSVPVDLVFRLTVTDDDGATATDTARVRVNALQSDVRVQLSGTVLPPIGQELDGDNNDPTNVVMSNDDPLQPQPIGNPTTVGGYVNEPSQGAPGRSFINGDPEDYFAVELLAGQRINLLVADFQEADADLYLYRPDGTLVDFSVETGEVEEIDIVDSGAYVVNVSIFSGASNYTLAIGAPGSSQVRRGDPGDVIPFETIVVYEQDETRARAAEERLRRRWEMRQVGGGSRRTRLMAMRDGLQGTQLVERRLGRQAHRRSQFADSALRMRWETLLTAKRLARQPGISRAEPNYRVRPSAEVNDEGFPFQWHYPLINVPGAWDTSTGSAEVVVAVVDTGILGGHPDLRDQLVDGYDFVRDARAAGDGDGIDPNPEETTGGADLAALSFHGTHVAGTIGAMGNNQIGVAGVAYGARVMPLRALTNDGGTSYDVLQAVRYAAGLPNDSRTLPAQPADIINLSLGGSGFSQISQNLYNEVRAMGIVVVAAAGNEGSRSPSFPAAYDNVISVSAVDAQQRITGYSNRGASIDVSAPGGDGRRDINGDGYPDGVLSTGGVDGEFAYTFLSGTSMAAPHVAGVFALMKSVNPQLDAQAIERLLRDGRLSIDLGAPGQDELYGFGLIDARLAVEAALAEAGGVSDSPPRLASSSSSLNFGSALNRIEFSLRNSGSGDLGDVRVQTDQPWLSVSAISVDALGVGRYAATVDRSELPGGIYQGTITADSDANSLSLRVLLGVADGSDADLGTVYLLLFDPVADVVVAEAELVADSVEGYRFTLSDVPAGNYEIFAGTDLDNDLFICDAGEACGAYLTIEDPLLLEVSEDIDNLNLEIEYLVALPGSVGATSDAAQGRQRSLRRKTRR